MPSVRCGFNDVEGGATGSQLLTTYGPTLLVDIGFDPDFEQVDGEGPPPKPDMAGIQALVDTGAGESCIDSALAAQT